MKKTVPIAIAATIAVAGTTYVVTQTGTCETMWEPDAGPADASPPPPTADASPPAPAAHSVRVTLRPSAAGMQWVSFGVPMPAGLLDSELNVRVRLDGVEAPAFIRSLGPWQALPPRELLCTGYNQMSSSVRAVLVQFQAELFPGTPRAVQVDLGVPQTAPLAEGVDPLSTFRVFDDAGLLYNGTEGFKEPATIAEIDPAWLRCSGITLGQAASVPPLDTEGEAARNFFTTSIADYRSTWNSDPGTWPCQTVPDLKSAEDGVWLYQRAQTFFDLYARTGLPDALRAAFQAFWHYRTLVYSPADCAAVPAASQKWCAGFFKPKNPDPASPYKDAKYSYAEDFATWYWLTGDETARPMFHAINEALKLAIPNLGWTERFAAYGLSAAVFEYEVTGADAALADARRYVDDLAARQARPASDGSVNPGCILGNTEWGADGFSPWMSPMLMAQLLRYYEASSDPRVPAMLAKQAGCIWERGMAVSDGTGGQELAGLLVPFYGARVTGPLADVDGGFPLSGVEHAINVAQGVALGAAFESSTEKRAALWDRIHELQRTAAWDFGHWTRTTANLPKFRLAPWRKFNWWFRHSGQIQWSAAGPEALP